MTNYRYITHLWCYTFIACVLCTPNLLADTPQESDTYLFYLLNDGHERGENNSTPQTSLVEEEEEEVVFVVVESMPEFPGGQQALFKFISDNLKYPTIAQENGIQGRVICQFIVNKDGSISGVEVTRSGGDPSLDKEAIRIIKSMPKWKPGYQRGKPARVKYTLPVTFKLL